MTPEDMYQHMKSERRRLSGSGIDPRPCVGCGGHIPKIHGGGRRKWCSDECRERSLARPTEPSCVGCGKRLVQPARSRPVKWCSEPCRKRTSYAGTCAECGGPTNGSNGPGRASKRCRNCVVWTRGSVISAFNAWADDNGGVPPTCTEQRDAPSGLLPPPDSVKRIFGSWNAGLLAAGFDLKTDRRPETALAVLEAIRAGEHTRDIAERFGWTTNNIHQRLRTLGTSIKAERPDWYVQPSRWLYMSRNS